MHTFVIKYRTSLRVNLILLWKSSADNQPLTDVKRHINLKTQQEVSSNIINTDGHKNTALLFDKMIIYSAQKVVDQRYNIL